MSREKQELLHAVRQFYFTILSPSFSHTALHSWWEKSLCPSEGDAVRFTLNGSNSAYLSLMITVSQQVPHFFSFSPLLCIPTLVCLAPSWQQPSLNKSPASQEWDSSCCYLAFIWCKDTHNIAHFCLPTINLDPYFRESLFVWENGTVATFTWAVFLSSLWFAVEILFSSFFGRFQQTKAAAIVFFWPLHTFQLLIRVFSFKSCGGMLIQLFICVNFPYECLFDNIVESWWLRKIS